MSTTFHVTFHLGPVPPLEPEWLREHLFEAAIRNQQRMHARLLPQMTPEVAQAYAQAKEATYDALRRARDTARLLPDATGGQCLQVEFDYDGRLDVSADGRALWLRQSFEDLLLVPIRHSLFERARAALLSEEPPSEADAALLRELHEGFDRALADANRLDSPGLTLRGPDGTFY